MADEAIFNRADEWILDGATWSLVAGSLAAGSTLDVLSSLRPQKRIMFTSGTATIRATIPGAKTARCFALPVSNADNGTLTIANGAGFSLAVPIPTMPAGRIPRTAVIQFPAPAASTTWDVIIAGSSANVILGGAIWFGQSLHTFGRNFRNGFRPSVKRFVADVVNPSGAQYHINHRTIQRAFDFDVAALTAQIAEMEDWQRSQTANGSDISLFWPDPTVNDAYLGNWTNDFAPTMYVGPNYHPLQTKFTELSKGQPV